MASTKSKLVPRPQPVIAVKLNPGNRRQGTFSDLPASGFVRLPKVLQVVPVSASGWWAGIQAGRFPKGVKLSPRVTAWSVESIRALISALNAGKERGDE